MLTLHEDERQKMVGLRAAYHAMLGMFLAALAVGFIGLFILEDDSLAFSAIFLVLVAIAVYHVSLWRGGWFEYAREMTSQTETSRRRARRQAVLIVGALSAWRFMWGHAISGRPLGRSLLGSLAGAAVVGALLWLFYLRPPRE
jgi:O-antigen/teichoic acid export membrane protein